MVAGDWGFVSVVCRMRWQLVSRHGHAGVWEGPTWLKPHVAPDLGSTLALWVWEQGGIFSQIVEGSGVCGRLEPSSWSMCKAATHSCQCTSLEARQQ